jgi:malate synthase
VLNDGRKISRELICHTIAEQLAHIRNTIGSSRYDSGKFPRAAELFEQMMFSDHCPEFLTLAAYQNID